MAASPRAGRRVILPRTATISIAPFQVEVAAEREQRLRSVQEKAAVLEAERVGALRLLTSLGSKPRVQDVEARLRAEVAATQRERDAARAQCATLTRRLREVTQERDVERERERRDAEALAQATARARATVALYDEQKANNAVMFERLQATARTHEPCAGRLEAAEAAADVLRGQCAQLRETVAGLRKEHATLADKHLRTKEKARQAISTHVSKHKHKHRQLESIGELHASEVLRLTSEVDKEKRRAAEAEREVVALRAQIVDADTRQESRVAFSRLHADLKSLHEDLRIMQSSVAAAEAKAHEYKTKLRAVESKLAVAERDRIKRALTRRASLM